MLDLDLSKVLLVAVVALVVVGPKELPHLLRAVGRMVSRLRSIQIRVHKAAVDFIAEADLESISKDVARIERGSWALIALNPATAMRGSLPALPGAKALASAPKVETALYASPEMQAYLSPASESPSGGDPQCDISGGIPVQVKSTVISSLVP